jgi:hypothetical protein
LASIGSIGRRGRQRLMKTPVTQPLPRGQAEKHLMQEIDRGRGEIDEQRGDRANENGEPD